MLCCKPLSIAFCDWRVDRLPHLHPGSQQQSADGLVKVGWRGCGGAGNIGRAIIPKINYLNYIYKQIY
jgi:hypothetical protein